jgi:N-acetyl-anhydromuramyl-L-alanine amidase AmpD
MGEFIGTARVPAFDFLNRSVELAGKKLSAHCLVSPGGTVVRCVPDEDVAYHAGVSSWIGREGLNDTFLGVELLLPGGWEYAAFKQALRDGTAVFTQACIEAAAWQVATWVEQHGIMMADMVRHSDVSGDEVRGVGKGKLDPGAGLDWMAFEEVVYQWREQFRLEVRNA